MASQSSNSGCDGKPILTEIAWCLHNAAAKMMLPDTIHHDSGRLSGLSGLAIHLARVIRRVASDAACSGRCGITAGSELPVIALRKPGSTGSRRTIAFSSNLDVGRRHTGP